jgi:cobaltochelatase CobN
MHRTANISGGFNPQLEDFFLEQTPADFVLITAADTDIQTLATAVTKLPNSFPTFRVANLLNLQQQISIDTYAEEVLEYAQVIILRLLGGRSYWSYGLEVVQELAKKNGTKLIVMPGDDNIDPDLLTHSNVSLNTVNQVWRYFNEGGAENFLNGLKFVSDICLSTSYNPPLPIVVPRIGVWQWENREIEIDIQTRINPENNSQIALTQDSRNNGTTKKRRTLRNESLREFLPQSWENNSLVTLPKVGILFYRAHYLSGNTKVIDALCQALLDRDLEPLPIFVSSLRDPEIQSQLITLFQPKDSPGISLLLNTTSFSLARLDGETRQLELWQKLDVPVLQVILSGGSFEQWDSSLKGLSPRDMAMNVALPEVDGRIISRAISFKTVQQRHPSLETDVMIYEPEVSRINFVADLAAKWVKLRLQPKGDRRVALILANYPVRDGRLANGVGLDTPESTVEILKALENDGYSLDNLPANGKELIERLTDAITNDPEGKELRPILQSISLEKYLNYFDSLSTVVKEGIEKRWGQEDNANIPIPGIQLGNIFIGIQPSRGYDIDPSLNYHAPDLEPTHAYLAFYYWIRECFEADAIIHVGKHGNLEWLPGKSVALSADCYPEVALGAMPNLYPFIVNDPGEGAQAKRRSQAVIIDHLTPPMTRAELYGSLQKLENLIDEYYESESLDPSRLPAISEAIQQLITEENLHKDLGIEVDSIQNFLSQADGYLCELKEAQIRDGLHIFGKCPQSEQLRDLIIAIARQQNKYHIGLSRAIAQEWNLDFDPLITDFSEKVTSAMAMVNGQRCWTYGDVVEVIEKYAARLVDDDFINREGAKDAKGREGRSFKPALQLVVNWIDSYLFPALQKTELEITHLLRGLDGRYVPSGPSGAPTRGRPEVLPTGNNFYSVDIRAIPTETAWDVGRKAAESVVECYTQEHGEYPKSLAISVWGTSTMRTGGDDIAEALALLGVQPVWDGVARRVIDFEILPLAILGRPRVDVTLRISGFFRDAFPNLIELFDQASVAVAALDESEEENPLAASVKEETNYWLGQGFDLESAKTRAGYRIFGSKPGAYGAGLQGLIESQNWSNDEDLAKAYINWSCYAYGGQSEVSPKEVSPKETGQNLLSTSPEIFERRLKQLQIVLQNQDNREHDLLDSDDYYQFQGGLTAAIRMIQGKNPETYFGDNSIPGNPKVRLLEAEIAKVYRSRVINPKWIAGVMRHGYKGAFEMSATVDFLFAYDATAKCVEDYIYEGVANAYLFNPEVSEFIQQNNPWALRDIAERLIEAYQRGLWQDLSIETLDNLRSLVHQAEADIEQKQMV